MRLKLKIELVEEMPLYAILAYVREIDDLYQKYQILENLLIQLENNISRYSISRKERYTHFLPSKSFGVRDQIISKSLPHFSPDMENNYDKGYSNFDNFNEELRILIRKIIRSKHPEVDYFDGKYYRNILDFNSENELVLRSLSVNSPPSISLEGLDRTIYQLRFGRDIIKREEENHELNKITKTLENASKIVSLENQLANSEIRPESKAYIHELLKHVQDKQEKLISSREFNKIEIFH